MSSTLSGQIEFGKSVYHLLDKESKSFQKTAEQTKSASEINIHYHRCYWKIDPSIKYISGEITTYFTWETASNQFSFDLVDGLEVLEVKRQDTNISFTHQNNLLTLNFEEIAEKGKLDSVTVKYQGEPPTTGFGSFVQFVEEDGPIIWTLSQPFGARDWWPCKQTLSDKADSIDIFVEHPAPFKAASNGLLQSINTDGETSVTHWKHRYPISTYLIAVAVANYEVYSNYFIRNETDSVEVLNYVYPRTLEYAQENTPLTADMIGVFETLFGEYPFSSEKYGHAQISWGGGMEHQTMSFMGDFDIYLNSHELAHQWFGNTVTCASWNDIWLNESFATFCTGIAFEFLRSEEEKLNWRRSYINLATSQPDGSVYVYNPTSTDQIFNFRLTYVKGAMVLNTLRWKLGDEIFFKALRKFLKDENLVYGFANTADIIRHFEEESEQDLSSFFDKWIYKEGYPVYEIFWNQTPEKLYLQVNQSTSHPSVDFYALPLPFRIRGNNGEVIDVRLEHNAKNQVFEIDLDFDANEIIFDPEYVILSKHEIFKVTEVWDGDLDILLYPNPAINQVNIKTNRSPSFIQEIEIYSNDGRLVERYSIENSQGQPINIKLNPELSAGLYHLRIKTQISTLQKKLMILRD